MAGGPAAPININLVVLPAAQLAGIDVTPRELYAVMSNKREWLQWLARHRLIRNNADCGSSAEHAGAQLGLPDLPYFTGDPIFQTLSPASQGEAAGKNESPVFC